MRVLINDHSHGRSNFPGSPTGREHYDGEAGRTEHNSDMILIPAGRFRMGSELGSPAESPEHVVELPEFWLNAAPVTNKNFAEFVAQTGYETHVQRAGSAWGFHQGEFQSVVGLSWRTYAAPERDQHPVLLIAWDDARAYCDWTGLRLPTEAEWERSARADQESAAFPWGDTPPNGVQSNFAGNPHGLPATTPVKRYAPNAFGLYDMVGNVWQWCSDWYDESYYVASPSANPPGPDSGTTKVRRGGAWNVVQSFRLRCANRGAMPPSQTASNMGFRCARSR